MSEPASGINGRILRQDQERATTNMLDDGDRFTRPREKRDDLLVVHVRATEASQLLESVVWGDARATSDCKLLAFVLDDVVVCRSIVKDFIRLLSIISSGTRSCP